MPVTLTIRPTPKIHKHVDACSFSFNNDQGRDIEAGEVIEVGGLIGITNILILDGENGSAQLLNGPVMGYRMYLDDPGAAADIFVGDAVVHPVGLNHLGYAIHQMVGTDPKGLNDPAVPLGGKCVCFLSLPTPAA